MHGTKLPPPLILDAPPDLAELVAAYATATTTTGRLTGYYGILRWFKGKRAQRTVFLADRWAVRCWGGDVHVGERYKALPRKDQR